MALTFFSYRLRQKIHLTSDVCELHFELSDAKDLQVSPGAYLMFSLPMSGLKRAYSLSGYKNGVYSCIIKRLSPSDEYPDGGIGSREICDLEIGDHIEATAPMGHFLLSQGDVSRAFIGTGTGFAPLYFQVSHALSRQDQSRQIFVYGVRSQVDQFYVHQMAQMAEQTSNFTYFPYLSRPAGVVSSQFTGYVTDWITPEHIESIDEFYLCGSPAMVKSARMKLGELGVDKSRIKFEQF